ncbi:MAG: hypothetical protein LDL09_06910 [Calditerrivibrio sp.]|nr:hypothetical protein [Calditerrivibrio sp.]
MIKKILFFALFSIISIHVFASNLFIEESNGKTILSFELGNQVEITEKKLDKNSLFIKLKGEYEISFDQFWNKNVNRVKSSKENGSTRLFIDFEKSPSKYDIVQTVKGFELRLEFPEKVGTETMETGNIFIRMLVSIFFIVVLILVFYWLIKVFMKKNYLGDIPGAGRPLGKVDLMPGKTIIFYEIKDTVYMFGVSGENISVLDKIEDSNVIDAIKAGFSKKEDFSSYFRFFGGGSIKDELKTSSTIIQDKVESLKKKN